MEIDLELARNGYLTLPDGKHHRFIHGLKRLAEDAIREGATIRWGESIGSEQARAYCWSRVIVLSPHLAAAEDVSLILATLSHELSHVIVGPSHRRAREYADWHYSDLFGVAERVEC